MADLTTSSFIDSLMGAATRIAARILLDVGYRDRGRVSIVAGTQSYAVSFAATLASVPTKAHALVNLPGPSGAGEAMTAHWDLSTVTDTGGTLVLSNMPSANAANAIHWEVEV